MTIDTFNQLLAAARPGARAYVPQARDTGRRQARVAVVYREGGQVYEYRGSIGAVAERLDLIPAVNVMAESRRVASALRCGETATGWTALYDTVAYLLGAVVETAPAPVDAHDRPQYTYSLA